MQTKKLINGPMLPLGEKTHNTQHSNSPLLEAMKWENLATPWKEQSTLNVKRQSEGQTRFVEASEEERPIGPKEDDCSLIICSLSVLSLLICLFVISPLQMVAAPPLKEPWVSKDDYNKCYHRQNCQVGRREGKDVWMKGCSVECGSRWAPAVIRGKWETHAALCKSKKTLRFWCTVASIWHRHLFVALCLREENGAVQRGTTEWEIGNEQRQSRKRNSRRHKQTNKKSKQNILFGSSLIKCTCCNCIIKLF